MFAVDTLNQMVEFDPRPDFEKQRQRFLQRFWAGRLDALQQLLATEADDAATTERRTRMTQLATRDAYGVLTEPTTLRIERLLPGPIERVWAYLTESDKRRQWLAAGDMEMRVGAPFELVWRNDELSAHDETRPDGFPEEQRMDSRITEIDPPNRLSFTWAGSGDVTMELVPQGGKILLTITHRNLPDRDMLIMVAAGWHMHLDTLVDRTTGNEPQPFWSGWRRLRGEYDRRLPA